MVVFGVDSIFILQIIISKREILYLFANPIFRVQKEAIFVRFQEFCFHITSAITENEIMLVQ